VRVDGTMISLLRVGELKYYFQEFHIGYRVRTFLFQLSNRETSCILLKKWRQLKVFFDGLNFEIASEFWS